MLLHLNVVLIACIHLVVAAEFQGYAGYKKYTVSHATEAEFEAMADLQLEDSNLDFWLLTPDMSVVVTSPAVQPTFEVTLNRLGVVFEAEPLGYAEEHSNQTMPAKCLTGGECASDRPKRQARGFFTHFPRYNEILGYMSALAARFPQFCRYETLGYSHEGRHLATLRISLDSRQSARRVAYIQAGTHGREWIAPITALYLANELLNNIHAFRSILDDTEILILPLANPDGYEFTHTQERYWRKNRHHYPNRSCVGVDINRNFPNNWNYRGASQNLCSEVFSGTTPASEAETAAITRYLQKNRHRVKLSVDLHSFGNFIFYPFGYERNTAAPTRSLLHAVASRAASQIAKYRGTRYTVGTSANILYEASGGLDDFAYGNLGIPMSFTVELPGDNFHVANSDIIHVCKETFAGLIELIRHVSLF